MAALQLQGNQQLRTSRSTLLASRFVEVWHPVDKATRWDDAADMLRWAVIFLVIAIIAGILGFTGIAGAAASIAKVLFGLFLIICIALFVAGVMIGKKLF